MSIVTKLYKSAKKELSPRMGAGGSTSRAGSAAASKMRKNNSKTMGAEGPKQSVPRNKINAPKPTGRIDPRNKKAVRRNINNLAKIIDEAVAKGIKDIR